MKELIVGNKEQMKMFENMCACHSNIEVIANVFGVSSKEVHYWALKTYKESNFACVYQRFMNRGNVKLMNDGLKLAEKNPMMNIWLRKQWLKEKDPDKQAINEQADIEDWQPIADLLK